MLPPVVDLPRWIHSRVKNSTFLGLCDFAVPCCDLPTVSIHILMCHFVCRFPNNNYSPNEKGCQGGDPLPMLLTMPRMFDYEGGSNLLGLGDIVLPGLLVSYAARFDAAKILLGVLRGGTWTPGGSPERKYRYRW